MVDTTIISFDKPESNITESNLTNELAALKKVICQKNLIVQDTD